MIVNFKKLRHDAVIPTFGHNDDSNAGIDFYSPDAVLVPSGGSVNIDLGIAWEPEELPGFAPMSRYRSQFEDCWKPAMIIKGRSGLSINHGIECCNAGIIDQGYTGPITVRLYNTTSYPYTINAGDRIAQGVVVLLPVIEVREINELSDTDRGTKGFGSSGR